MKKMKTLPALEIGDSIEYPKGKGAWWEIIDIKRTQYWTLLTLSNSVMTYLPNEQGREINVRSKE